MILVDINKEEVCLMCMSKRVYHYNTIIDLFILIARITSRDKSSDDVNRSWEEVPRILWLNGHKRKERNPAPK
jgi:hypothetical protein